MTIWQTVDLEEAHKVTPTPGPWRRSPGGLWVEADDPYGQGSMSIASVLGLSHLGGCGRPTDEAVAELKANAQIIACAPELLEVVRDLSAVITRGRILFEYPGLHDRAKALIARVDSQ